MNSINNICKKIWMSYFRSVFVVAFIIVKLFKKKLITHTKKDCVNWLVSFKLNDKILIKTVYSNYV